LNGTATFLLVFKSIDHVAGLNGLPFSSLIPSQSRMPLLINGYGIKIAFKTLLGNKMLPAAVQKMAFFIPF
jgi:hypothetical protein